MYNRHDIKVRDLPQQLKAVVKSLTRRQKGSICVADQVSIGSMQWDSGSRELYTVVELATGRSQQWSDDRPWPENMHGAGKATMRPGYVIVRHGTFMGKDSFPTIYAHADDVTKMLPAS